MSPGDHCDHAPFEKPDPSYIIEIDPWFDKQVALHGEINAVVNPFLGDTASGKSKLLPVPPEVTEAVDALQVDALFKQWSLTPDGYRVRDSRIPSDPIRLGSILDDNARMAFIAGFKAANR